MRVSRRNHTSVVDHWPFFFYLLITLIVMLIVVLLKEAPDSALIQPTIIMNKGFNPPSIGEIAAVNYIYDGDTIKLNNGKVVRYIGIDSPELYSNKESNCYAREAFLKNKELVLNKNIILEKDISDKDRYGRILRYVWVGGILLNELLVREGYATAVYYPPDGKYFDRLKFAEQEARSDGKGMWGECEESKSK